MAIPLNSGVATGGLARSGITDSGVSSATSATSTSSLTSSQIGGVAGFGMGILGTIGNIQSLNDKKTALRQQEMFNQEVYKQRSIQAKQDARLRARQIGKQKDIVRGKTIGAIAKSGVQLSGSPMDVLIENMTAMETDRQRAFRQGQVESTNIMNQAAISMYKMKVQRAGINSQRRAAVIQGIGQAAGSVLMLAG